MYFVEYTTVDNKVAVADTKDNVVELLARSDLDSYIRSGVSILSWLDCKGLITYAMIDSCNSRLLRYIVKHRDCEEDILEYLKTHCVYAITDIIHSNKTYIEWDKYHSFFDYLDTRGFYALFLTLHSGNKLIVKISAYGNVECRVVDSKWGIKYYPSCSGDYVLRHCQLKNIRCDKIYSGITYLNLVNITNTNEMGCLSWDNINDSLVIIKNPFV